MNTSAVHETFRLRPADSVAYRCNPPFHGRKSKNPPMAAHLRWGEAMNDRQWGWRVAMFVALFFNVRERGDGFRASVLFPETRIGATRRGH